MLWGTGHQKLLRFDGYCVTEGPRLLLSSSQGQTGTFTCQVVGAGKGEAGVHILHFLPTPQAPPGLRRAQRHFFEKRFNGAAKRPVDFELVTDRHLRNSARERDQAWSGALS
jgi:hypothetical protein